MDKYTPEEMQALEKSLPWRVHAFGDSDIERDIIDNEGNLMIDGITVEMAHFIVRAVNAHEELLKLLKIAYFTGAVSMPGQAQKDWFEQTAQAIAKAGGK